MAKKTKRISKSGARTKKEQRDSGQGGVRPEVLEAYRESNKKFRELYSKLSQKD